MARKKRQIAVADAETDPFEIYQTPEPFVWGYYDGEQYEQFWGDDCCDRFAEFIQDKYVFLYLHNGGKFDLYFLLPWLDPKLMMIKQRIAEATIGECRLRDSYLILPLPLAAHGKNDFEYWKLKREYRDTYRREIEDYLYSDCVNLFEWVNKFVDRFGTNLTLASTAMKQLRNTEYEVALSNEGDDNKFRPFYFGGRTQAFQTGRHDGPIDYYDINSAYPFAMLFRHPRAKDAVTLNRLPDVNAPYFAVIDAISYGALPYRGVDGSLQFPNDDEVRTYYVTGWEIQAGLDTKTIRIIRTHKSYVFTDTSDFSDFVNQFYSEKLRAKQTGDKDTELFSKLILNSCYGKFGQNPRRFKDFQITEIGEYPDEAEEDFNKLFGVGYEWLIDENENKKMPEDITDPDLMIDKGWHKTSETETGHAIWEKDDPGYRYFNVATAASITGFVRAYLWRAICRSDGVLYCDTDSIMAQKFDGPIGTELGQWSKEANLIGVWIGGKKLYAALTDENNKDGERQWKVASKGVRLQPLDVQRIVENGETVRWENIAPAFSLTRGTQWVARDIRMTG